MSIDEPARLAALESFEILDTAPEQVFDDVVCLAAAICDAPTALINFVDATRQWTKAWVGEAQAEISREQSFCARTILEPDGVYIVPDALADPDWVDHPDVVGRAGLRFYAGAAIRDDAGYALGAVCVTDSQIRVFDEQQLDALRRLARLVADHLRHRAQTAEAARVNQELRDLAIHDALTGLVNRPFFEEVLAIALRQRDVAPPGVLFCDLDAFKPVNDLYGHDTGDTLLKIVAQRLLAGARDGDLVARFGGDEFLILCPRVTLGELDAVAGRMRAHVGRPVELAAARITPSVSVGLALAGASETAASLLQRADAAM